MARLDLRSSLLTLASLVLGCGAIFLLHGGTGVSGLRLVDRLDEARLETRGEFPLFDEQRRLRRGVTLSGERLESITPPFPSRLAFELRVPSSPTLEVSTALVLMEDVRQARVRFSIEIETAQESATVFEQVKTRDDANRWEGSSIDLSRWAGQDAAIVLIASPLREREDVLWANRVLVAWGDPVIRDSGGLPGSAADLEDWLRARMPPFGGLTMDDLSWTELTFNLLLAGLFSLCLSIVHRSGSGRHGEELPRGLTLFTLTTTLVIATVHSSVALSLGLLGALSIFRFRGPIPSREHLLYLLLCIAVALPLGVNLPQLGAAVVLISILVAAATRVTARPQPRRFLLTASGRLASGSGASVADAFEPLSDSIEVEGLEVRGRDFTMSARMNLEGSKRTVAALSSVQGAFEDLRISLQAVDGIENGR